MRPGLHGGYYLLIKLPSVGEVCLAFLGCCRRHRAAQLLLIVCRLLFFFVHHSVTDMMKRLKCGRLF